MYSQYQIVIYIYIYIYIIIEEQKVVQELRERPVVHAAMGS